MKLTQHERRLLRSELKRPHGEIVAVAKKYGIPYISLWRWCRDNPSVPTEELAKRGPTDPREAGRRGGLKSAENRRNR